MELLASGARRLDAVEQDERLDRPVGVVRAAVNRALSRPVKDALHGRWLGHPLHPALTDGAGVPAVYDGVGQATFEASLASLRPRGILVLYGQSSGPVPPFDLGRLSTLGSLSITRAPSFVASWVSSSPTPPAAACTSTVSPARTG